MKNSLQRKYDYKEEESEEIISASVHLNTVVNQIPSSGFFPHSPAWSLPRKEQSGKKSMEENVRGEFL